MSIVKLTARDLMTTDVTFVRPDEKVAAVDLLMVRKSLGGVPILEYSNDELIGIVTQRDIMLSRFRTTIAGLVIENLMTKNPLSVLPQTPIKEVLGLMLSHQIERVPVVENKKLVGMIEPESIIEAIHHVFSSSE